MKKYSIFTSTAISIFALICLSCKNSGSSSFTKQDSLAIKRTVKTKFIKYSPSGIPYGPIEKDSVIKMAACYDKFPTLYNESVEPVLGFTLSETDWEAIKKISGASKLFFRFGIKNYGQTDEIENGEAVPQYTLIVIPVDKDNNQMLNYAYDYNNPCPPYCPK